MDKQILSHRTVVITGGTSEIGRALTLDLANEGADIAIVDKNPEKARRILAEVDEIRERNEKYGRCAYFETDLTQAKNVKESVSRVAEAFGGIDILVAGLQTAKVSLIQSDSYLEDFERLIDVNTKTAVFTTHSIIPYMKGRKRGKIIYLISDLVRWGSEGESLTAISRGGIVYYARSLARELASSNIAVNCIAMGPTEDYLLARDPSASSIKQTEEKLIQAMPMARTLAAEEISKVVVFMASSQSDAVTGQTWAVNGGLTMF